MKKLNLAILALSLLIAVACSKKTTPPVITVAAPPATQVTAKVNGTRPAATPVIPAPQAAG